MAHQQLSFREEVRNAAIFQWNARGLRSRIADFRRFVYANRFPIIIICEPNLSNSIRLSGYESFMSSTRGEKSKVMVFIRRDLTYILHPVPPDDNNQYVCLTVKKKKDLPSLLWVRTYHHQVDLTPIDYETSCQHLLIHGLSSGTSTLIIQSGEARKSTRKAETCYHSPPTGNSWF